MKKEKNYYEKAFKLGEIQYLDYFNLSLLNRKMDNLKEAKINAYKSLKLSKEKDEILPERIQKIYANIYFLEKDLNNMRGALEIVKEAESIAQDSTTKGYLRALIDSLNILTK